MKKFFIFLVFFLMIVSSQSQNSQTPAACGSPAACEFFQKGSNVIVYFYCDGGCTNPMTSTILSFSQQSLPTGCVLFSNGFCKQAWEAFTTTQVKSAKLNIVRGGYGAVYFYSTDDCSGNEVKVLSLFSSPPKSCTASGCYSASHDSDCFNALKNLLEQTPQSYQFCQNIVSSAPPNLQTLSLLALLFTFSLLGMIYAIGELSNSSSIKAFVKTEYFEAVKSAILLVGILSIISTLNSMILPLTGERDLINGACQKALEIKGDVVSGSTTSQGIENVLQDVFNYAFYLGILAPFSITFGLGFTVQAFKVSDIVAGTFMPSSIIEWAYPPTKFTLMNYIVNDPVYGIENSFLISIARLIILSLTPVFVYQFLLPIGLFLRSFPILRKVGGFFIALSISLLIIYPSLVLFIDYPFMSTIINAVYPTSATQLTGYKLEYTIPGLNIKIDLFHIIAVFLPIISLAFGQALGRLLQLYYLLIAIPSINSLYLPLNYFLSALAVNLGQMVVVVIDLLIMYVLLLDLSDIIGGKFTIAGREISGFGFLRL